MKSRAVSQTTIVFVLLLVTFLSSSPAAGRQPAPVESATGQVRQRFGSDNPPCLHPAICPGYLCRLELSFMMWNNRLTMW